jgi:hypothetical protein
MSSVGSSPGITSSIVALVEIERNSFIGFGGLIRVSRLPVGALPSASPTAPTGKYFRLDPNKIAICLGH